MARWSILAALLCLAACDFAPQQRSGGVKEAQPSIEQLKPVARHLVELIEVVNRGDGREPLLEWIAYEQPQAEAHSFLEYPPEFGAGRVYYWGDRFTPVGDYCAVRMMRDYTPVQIYCTLGWYEQVTGVPVAELKDEYFLLHQQHEGVSEARESLIDEEPDQSYTFRYEGVAVGLMTRAQLPDKSATLALIMRPEQVEEAAKRNERYPELKEFATVDASATLDDLIALLVEQGARGILDHFDFSAFVRHMWYRPPDGSDQRDYEQATMYVFGSWEWRSESACYLAAFDEGRRAQLVFTPAWYAAHAGHDIAELAAAFDALMGEHGQGSFVLDADDDAFDVEFAWAYVDGVNVVRRLYSAPAFDHEHGHYTLYAGEPLFADAPPNYPTLMESDLPALEADAGAFEGFAREIALAPAAELLARRVVGFRRDEYRIPLQRTSPFTMRQVYSNTDPLTRYRLAEAELLDDTYLKYFECTPVWLSAQLAVSQGELAAEFAKLLRRYGQRAPRAGGRAGTDDGGTEAETLHYGPLVISREPGEREDGADTWYRLELPTWP